MGTFALHTPFIVAYPQALRAARPAPRDVQYAVAGGAQDHHRVANCTARAGFLRRVLAIAPIAEAEASAGTLAGDPYILIIIEYRCH
jgi:hypothetical protein